MQEIQVLLDGYHLFRKKYFNKHSKKFSNLVKYGQKPNVLVISCSDSRVDPAILMNCKPGDLFVVRNVANLVPTYEMDQGYHGTSAALEFGVCTLKINKILILGHTQCGGITSLVEQNSSVLKQQDSFIGQWMGLAAPAYEATMKNCSHLPKEMQVDECGKYALIQSYNNILTFPWIAESVKNQSLTVHVWNFDLKTGLIEVYHESENCFKLIF